jgi:cytochrome c5
VSDQRTCTHFGFAIGMVAVVVGLILVINSTMQGILAGHAGPEDMSPEAIAKRIAPVGQLNTGAAIMPTAAAAPAAAAPAAARTGEEVFKGVCFACHQTGAAGAPKFGDKAAWAPRIKQGMDVLFNHALHGFTGKTGMMPPKGTCGNCTDAELKGAIEYMTSHSK